VVVVVVGGGDGNKTDKKQKLQMTASVGWN